MATDKLILDACCGSRMFWFNKNNPDVLFADIRNEDHVLCDGRELHIRPDVQHDFRKMPYADNSFKVVVFDPPHFPKLGETSWMGKKYGILKDTWETDIKQGFDECYRVLDEYGTLIFKWNESQITIKKIIEVIGHQPLIGHTTKKGGHTVWMIFLKTSFKP